MWNELAVLLTSLFRIALSHGAEIRLCVQCLSELDPECIFHPPAPMPCNSSELRSCIVIEEKNTDGELLRLTRTCSPDDIISDECDHGLTKDGFRVLVCHYTCDKDGCNSVLPSAGSEANYICWLVPLVIAKWQHI